MTIIRKATIDDFTQIYTLLTERMYPEQGLLPLAPVKVAYKIAQMIETNCVFVAEKDGKIVGTISYEEMIVWYTETPIYGDVWIYVAPEHRNGTIGPRLFHAMTDATKDKLLMCGVVGKNLDGQRLFARLKPCGHLFLRNPDGMRLQ